MAISSYPVQVAKRTIVTLTSGTSWTVPAGVTSVNVTLYGGGGGGCSSVGASTSGNAGSTGGTTTFTGATSATGGTGAPTYARIGWNSIVAATGLAATSNSGLGGYSAGSIDYNGSQGLTAGPAVTQGNPGQIISSNLTTTPGASITYAIGAGGAGGSAPLLGQAGGAGGSGRIDVEYWI